jgi:hypothetical protein
LANSQTAPAHLDFAVNAAARDNERAALLFFVLILGVLAVCDHKVL